MPSQHQPTLPSPTPTNPSEGAVRRWAQARMKPSRFTHTEGVVRTAARLAAQYAPDHVDDLRLAGWIHDAAKSLSDTDLLAEAERYGLPVRPVERQSPQLLHGAVALAWAEEAFILNNPVITSAVLYHTTGHPEMSPADKVFFLADLTEPSRPYAWIDRVRAILRDDLDQALLFAVTTNSAGCSNAARSSIHVRWRCITACWPTA